VAKRLADGGAKVALVDINEQAAKDGAAAIGATAIGIGADVTKRDQVQAAVDEVVAQLGGLHILVNNAGVIRDNMLFKMTDDDWTTIMEVHLRGAFLFTQAAQKHMVDAKYGRIVFLSSTSALGNRGQANYSTAKAGLQGLARTVAIELGPFGVTANAVAPGFIETAMTKATAERIGITIEEMRERVSSTIPVRRGGLPEDVANVVAFYAAEESGYITGQVLYLDGGARLI
jgi:3-oxoacyl-[acyl-carrier protein] reductase